MESETRGPEEGKSSEDLLEKLREQLRSTNASVRRQAAFNLSWMQEDGLEILKAVLFSNAALRTKNAAAYGLRKMRGRMKKPALDVFTEGVQHTNDAVREVCVTALDLMRGGKGKAPSKRKASKTRIQDISRQRRPRRRVSHLSERQI